MSYKLKLFGQNLILDPQGAVAWPEQNALIISDVYLDRSESTVHEICGLIKKYQPRIITFLGNCFEKDGRLAETSVEIFKNALVGRQLYWITPRPDKLALRQFKGVIAEEMRLGTLTLRHKPSAGSRPGEIAGYFHPKAVVDMNGTAINFRCFVSDGQRLILPAFKGYTAGMFFKHPSISNLFATNYHAFVASANKVMPVQSYANKVYGLVA